LTGQEVAGNQGTPYFHGAVLTLRSKTQKMRSPNSSGGPQQAFPAFGTQGVRRLTFAANYVYHV
jgi:hypothetical protein